MKIYRTILAAALVAVSAAGFSSCDNDFDYPPVICPDLGGDGSAEAPLTVDGVNAYYTAYYSEKPDASKYYWMTGYIVGCTTTTETVFTTTDETATFKAPFGSNSNLLIAATPDCTDWSKCASVQLPSGGVRTNLNLSDNPTNLGKQVTLCGYIDKYIGIPGLRSVVAFAWGDKGDPNATPDTPSQPSGNPQGDGTLASPWNVAAVAKVFSSGSLPTSEIYVAGTISQIKEVDTGSYGNATYYISDDGTTSGQLEIYHGYYLDGEKFTSANQIKVGDKVVVKGKLTEYSGRAELQSCSIVSLNGTGGGGAATPSGTVIYSGLSANFDGWTIDNVDIPDGLDYIWSWKEYNGSFYLNGSAYLDGANASEAYAFTTVDLSGCTDSAMTFDHAAKFQTTLTQLCGAVAREVGANQWIDLQIPKWPASGSWTFANAGVIDLKAFDGKKIQLGFRYKSSAVGADTWEIKNLVVTATK